MLLIQTVINIGMNVGVLPVTGIPLPLISYGGSSLVVVLISLGLVQNIAYQSRICNTFTRHTAAQYFQK